MILLLNNAHAGNFKARLSASDGITHATRFVDFSLSFTHTRWLLIAGGGGGSTLPAYANGGGGGAGGYRSFGITKVLGVELCRVSNRINTLAMFTQLL